jgi:hypothetical protein
MADKTYYAKGLHVGEIVGQQLSKAKTGTFQIVLDVKILGLADPSDQTSFVEHEKQYVRTIYMPVTEKSAPYVWKRLEKIGYEGTTFGPLDPSHPEHESFVGKQIDVQCDHETGTDKNVYDRFSIPIEFASGREHKELEKREIRQLDSLFGKGKIKPVVEAKKPEDENQDLGITDDDIPF